MGWLHIGRRQSLYIYRVIVDSSTRGFSSVSGRRLGACKAEAQMVGPHASGDISRDENPRTTELILHISSKPQFRIKRRCHRLVALETALWRFNQFSLYMFRRWRKSCEQFFPGNLTQLFQHSINSTKSKIKYCALMALVVNFGCFDSIHCRT